MSHSVNENFPGAARNWWSPLLLGAGLILLGVWCLRHPEGTLLGLAQLFNIMLFISGVLSMGFAISNSGRVQGWGWTLAGGAIELLLALVLLRHPEITELALNFLLGFWLMFRGFYLISTSLDLRLLGVSSWSWVLAGGILSTVLAFFVLINPFAGAVALAVWAGLSLIASGFFTVLLAIGLRKLMSRL